MVHTTIIPDRAVVELALPNHYIGKKVEFLIYVSDEIERLKPAKAMKASQFKGVLNLEEAASFNQYYSSTAGMGQKYLIDSNVKSLRDVEGCSLLIIPNSLLNKACKPKKCLHAFLKHTG